MSVVLQLWLLSEDREIGHECHLVGVYGLNAYICCPLTLVYQTYFSADVHPDTWAHKTISYIHVGTEVCVMQSALPSQRSPFCFPVGTTLDEILRPCASVAMWYWTSVPTRKILAGYASNAVHNAVGSRPPNTSHQGPDSQKHLTTNLGKT